MQAASGSQCKEMKRGLTWALLGLLKIKRAAEFLFIYRGLIKRNESPPRRALQ